jgi:Max protein
MAERGDISDEDQDIDIESDDDDTSSSLGGNQFLSEADKKAHHNALERKRRDHIKESFISLRDTIPTLRREKVGRMTEKTSRAQILKHATEYIQFMNKKNIAIQKDIDSMKRQNQFLKQQVLAAERSNGSSPASLPLGADTALDDDIIVNGDDSSADSSESAAVVKGVGTRRRKRARVSR